MDIRILKIRISVFFNNGPLTDYRSPNGYRSLERYWKNLARHGSIYLQMTPCPGLILESNMYKENVLQN